MKIISTVVLMGTLAQQAVAQDQFGNGGDAVVCQTGRRQTVELYDFVEAPVLYDHIISLPDGNTWQEIVAGTLERMRTVDQQRTETYLRWLSEFENERRWVNGNLQDISDSDHWVIPAGCEIKQIAIQETPDLTRFRYFIDRSLWDQMATDHQAGLVLHELFYREAFEQLGHQDSRKARYFMTFIAANENLTLQAYNLEAGKAKFAHGGQRDLYSQGFLQSVDIEDFHAVDMGVDADAIYIVGRDINCKQAKNSCPSTLYQFDHQGVNRGSIDLGQANEELSITQSGDLSYVLSKVANEDAWAVGRLNGRALAWNLRFDGSACKLSPAYYDGIIVRCDDDAADAVARIDSDGQLHHVPLAGGERTYLGTGPNGEDYWRWYDSEGHLGKVLNGEIIWERPIGDYWSGGIINNRLYMGGYNELMVFSLNNQIVDSFVIPNFGYPGQFYVADMIVSLFLYGSSSDRGISAYKPDGQMKWKTGTFGQEQLEVIGSDHAGNIILQGPPPDYHGHHEPKVQFLLNAENGTLSGHSENFVPDGCSALFGTSSSIQVILSRCDNDQQTLNLFQY